MALQVRPGPALGRGSCLGTGLLIEVYTNANFYCFLLCNLTLVAICSNISYEEA